MAKASQGMKTGDISDARDSEDEEVEIHYKVLLQRRRAMHCVRQ